MRKGKKMFNESQIAEALNTVLEITEYNTKRMATFTYYGHTKSISITVYPYGFCVSPDIIYVFSDYGYTPESDCVIYQKGKKISRIFYHTFDDMIADVKAVKP